MAHAQERGERVGLERAREAADEVELVEAQLLGDLKQRKEKDMGRGRMLRISAFDSCHKFLLDCRC